MGRRSGLELYPKVRWDDLRFPAQGINPAGGAAPPSVDTATGLLVFAGNQDNDIGGAAQMPHSWKAGSIVRPHLHLRFTTSNAGKNTRWAFSYDIANPNSTWSNVSGTYTALATITVANPASVNKHVVAGFGDLTMANFHESAIILWRVTRLASSDAADDDTSAVQLVEFDIHYQLVKQGTFTEFPT